MENKIDLKQFEGHTPERFKDISSSPHLFGEFAPSDRRLLRAAPDLLAEVKELRATVKRIREIAGAALVNVEKDNGGPGCCETISDILVELEGK